MSDELLSVCMAENGYVIKVRGREKGTPAPEKNKYGEVPWKEAEVYVALDIGKVLEFIKTTLPDLIPFDSEEGEDDEYGNSFRKAIKNDD